MKSMTILGMTQRTMPAISAGDELLPGLPAQTPQAAETRYDWKVSVVGFGRRRDDAAAETMTFSLRTPDPREARAAIERASREDLASYRAGD